VTPLEEEAPERRIDPRAITACLVLVLTPASRFLATLDDRDGPDYAQHTVLFAVDIALAVLVVQQLPQSRAIVRAWRTHLCALSAVVLAVALVPSFLAHPGDRGVAALFRLVGLAALACLLPDLDDLERRLVGSTAAAVLALSAVAAMYQRATGGPLGLQGIGEDSDGVLDIVGGVAPFGLFVHPYVQAAWACVAGLGLVVLRLREDSRYRAPFLLVLLALPPIGLTLCRSGVLSSVAASIPLLLLALRSAKRREALLTVAAVGVVVGLSVAWNLDGWIGRADNTVSSGDPTALRGSLFDQARGLLDDDKALGVGPGQYVLALYERPDLVALNPQVPRPVHNVPILLVVEGGLVAAPAVALLVAAVVAQAWRAGAGGWVLVGAFAPFLLLDHLAWSFPQGLVLAGLWLGWLDVLAQTDR
jgi:hypothetical protein